MEVGTRVWLREEAGPRPYSLAEVISASASGGLRLRLLETGGGKEVAANPRDIFLAAASDAATETDNCSLSNLSDASLLHNTKARLLQGDIYTFTGDIVTSVNPCYSLPALYSVARMQEVCIGELTHAHPHVFVVCERAYRQLRHFQRQQALVISGVSGAGKTEAAKYCLRYLCWRSRPGDPAGAEGGVGGERVDEPLTNAILRSNPVFEALGNATTVRGRSARA